MLNVSSCRRGLSLLSTMPFSSLKSTSNRPTSGLNESDVRERPHFVSDKKRSDALVLFEHGLGYSKVAEILEINMNTVHEWAKLYLAGRFKKQIPQKQFRYEQEFKDQCIRMRLDGASWNQISRTMNVSPRQSAGGSRKPRRALRAAPTSLKARTRSEPWLRALRSPDSMRSSRTRT